MEKTRGFVCQIWFFDISQDKMCVKCCFKGLSFGEHFFEDMRQNICPYLCQFQIQVRYKLKMAYLLLANIPKRAASLCLIQNPRFTNELYIKFWVPHYSDFCETLVRKTEAKSPISYARVVQSFCTSMSEDGSALGNRVLYSEFMPRGAGSTRDMIVPKMYLANSANVLFSANFRLFSSTIAFCIPWPSLIHLNTVSETSCLKIIYKQNQTVRKRASERKIWPEQNRSRNRKGKCWCEDSRKVWLHAFCFEIKVKAKTKSIWDIMLLQLYMSCHESNSSMNCMMSKLRYKGVQDGCKKVKKEFGNLAVYNKNDLLIWGVMFLTISLWKAKPKMYTKVGSTCMWIKTCMSLAYKDQIWLLKRAQSFSQVRKSLFLIFSSV